MSSLLPPFFLIRSHPRLSVSFTVRRAGEREGWTFLFHSFVGSLSPFPVLCSPSFLRYEGMEDE